MTGKSRWNFNPHRREGGDAVRKEGQAGVLYFNPHHREGGDTLLQVSVSKYPYFNPHHREGGDDKSNNWYYGCCNFNPHHREGGDPFPSRKTGRQMISIHTTAKVVTGPNKIKLIATDISIHTTAKVVTREPGGQIIGELFQSTPPRRW